MKKLLILIVVILILGAGFFYFYNNTEEEVIAKECYIGGCSGELCTDDPEAISTCELLSGMECLGEGMVCEFVQGECAWTLSQEAAQCFMNVEQEYGGLVRESRIGYLFDKAEELLK